jgi:hypothetical protein
MPEYTTFCLAGFQKMVGITIVNLNPPRSIVASHPPAMLDISFQDSRKKSARADLVMIGQFVNQVNFKTMFINIQALTGQLKAPSKNNFCFPFWIE